MNGEKNGKNTHTSVFFRNLKGPYDDLLKWPIPRKSYTFTLLINDIEVETWTSKSTDNGGKWKDQFIRPTCDEFKRLGYPKAFQHNLVENVAHNDVVVIKYDIDFEEENEEENHPLERKSIFQRYFKN